mmetsp:Transcript_33401/g.74906  ORF Transcript_33401/g.74906 Transcript_33401/m.74906 type:complete len:158 (-) Transcript_33401:124-597(-)
MMRTKSHEQAMKAIAFICMLVAMAACFAVLMQGSHVGELAQTQAKAKASKPKFYGVSHIKTWGKVYEPVLQKIPRSASQISYPLKGAAAEEFASIHKEAQKLENVYDPATDRTPSKNMPKHTGVEKNDKWWAFTSYHGSAAQGGDSWWQHDHTNRGY